MITLHNEHLTIDVAEHGAELCSLRTAEHEYLWQADPEYWARHSPVLFPIVGNVYDKTFRFDGTPYPMGQHGFARDTDFAVVSQTADEVWLRLESNEATRRLFPADFCLEIGYRLHERCVDVMWRVANPSAAPLHFQIGAHPAFYWPTHDAEQEARGFFGFDPSTSSGQAQGTLTSRKIIGKGCVSPDETFDVNLDAQGMLPLSADTFDAVDTIILEGGQVHRVALCDTERKPVLSVTFEHPVVGLWSPPGRRAPFVCIEPWWGRCDTYGFEGEFADRDWVNHLAPGETFSTRYTVEIH